MTDIVSTFAGTSEQLENAANEMLAREVRGTQRAILSALIARMKVTQADADERTEVIRILVSSYDGYHNMPGETRHPMMVCAVDIARRFLEDKP